MKVCHKCDNPACVNPDHLFLGTQRDNVVDMFNKNRKDNKLEKHPRFKLTRDLIIQIRTLLDRGISQEKIAALLGIAQGTVSVIKRGARWRHVF